MILKYAWFSYWLCSQLSLVKDKKKLQSSQKKNQIFITCIHCINWTNKHSVCVKYSVSQCGQWGVSILKAKCRAG